jgi:hypothetical protein
MIRVFVGDDSERSSERVAAWLEPYDDLSYVGTPVASRAQVNVS